MTSNGALVPGNAAVDAIIRRLGEGEQLRRARPHPIQVLSALLTYRAGQGARGKLTWDPITPVIHALDRAFHDTFRVVEPAGTRHLLALDVSGSMAACTIAGVPGLSPRVASAAMSALALATEPKVETVAFTSAHRSHASLSAPILRLAASGNPSILMSFWAPVLYSTDEGHELRDLAGAFIGRHVVPRYRCYMRSRAMRLLGTQLSLLSCFGPTCDGCAHLFWPHLSLA